VSSTDDAAGALEGLRARRATAATPPVTVAWEGDPVRIELPGEWRDPVELRLRREDGSVEEGRGRPRDGTVRLPFPVPTGYHDVEIKGPHGTGGTPRARTRLIRAPRRSWAPEASDGSGEVGLFAPLYALRSDPDRGVGDLGTLGRFARWAREVGASRISTLPLYATFLGPDGFDPSPYSPVSRLFWNEVYLELDTLPGLDEAPAARALLESSGAGHDLGRAPRVPWRRVAALKRQVVEAVVEEVVGEEGGGPLGPVLRERLARDPELGAYARFRARSETLGSPWPDWDEPARSGTLDPARPPPGGAPEVARFLYHAYAQWAFDLQLREGLDEEAAELYLDLPLGSNPHGFDVWSNREIFARGFTGGAPPDAFFQGGQDWGFPPLHPSRSREAGHGYWIRCLRHLMGVSRTIRLDHAMSLHRLFWVPEGGTALEGAYIRYPHPELWAILCLESHRHRCRVVGEDLGTVPSEVPRSMERHGVGRMWILPFELTPGDDDVEDGETDHDDRAGEAPRRTEDELSEPGAVHVASLSTHDLPPFAAFWTGEDIRDRVDRGHLEPDAAAEEARGRAEWRRAFRRVVTRRGIDLPPPDPDGPSPHPASALAAALELLARSGAGSIVVSLNDLLLGTEPQNRPGTTSGDNWTLRLPASLPELARDSELLARIRILCEPRTRDSSSPPSDHG
jgi:4-alpha-glucanotransferase